MIYQSIFLSKARLELLNAWSWYEDRQVGLGDRFKEEIVRCTVQIEKNPQRFPIRKLNYHEAAVNIFPYLIIYRIQKKEKQIVVVSIFHTKRSPNKKYKTQ